MIKTCISISDLRQITNSLYAETGYDFRDYALGALKYRIERVMRSYNFETSLELISFLSGNKTFQDNFVSDLQISGTELFRDPEMWSALKKNVLSKFAKRKPIRVFVPCTVTGEELYTFINIMNDVDLYDDLELVVGVLTNRNELQVKQAVFSMRKAEQTKKNIELLDTEKTFDDYFAIRQDTFTSKIKLPPDTRFIVQSLLKTDSSNMFDIVVFRNKLLNFNDKMHREAMQILYECLNKGGHLLLGIGELPGELYKRRLKEIVKGERIFIKKSY